MKANLKINNSTSTAFILRQIADLKRGGFVVILKKYKTGLKFLTKPFFTVLFLPLALIIRVIRPIVHIRFGKLITNRIGHFAFEPEMYLCEKDMKIQKQGTLDLFYRNGSVSNTFLLKMWRREITILPWLIQPLDWASRILPYSSNHIVPLHSHKHEDAFGLLDKLPAHLKFTNEEESNGQEQLRLLGVPAGAKFICFHARDAAYLNQIFHTSSDYHNFRDSNVQNYLLAAKTMTEKGYFLIRIGAIVMEPLEVSDPMIIDYPYRDRSEFMDIFLLANCRFFIAANSGPCAIPTIFRVPNAFINVAPFLGAHGISRTEDLFIPKKYWNVSDQRHMSLNEIFKSGSANFLRGEQYSDIGIALIENTPEEICDLVEEMELRLNGLFKANEEDDGLHQRYEKILAKNGCEIRKLPRIGTAFLRQNRYLLDI